MKRLINRWERDANFRIIVLILAITLFGIILLSSQSREMQWENHPSDFGTRDFVAFWSAFHTLNDGNNPYSLSEIYPFQSHVIADEGSVQAFLNPPWSLAVLAPILAFDFNEARFLWIALNILFVYITTFIISSYLHGDKSGKSNLFLAGLLFLPSLWALWYGQLSIFLTACFVGAFSATLKGRGKLAGLLFIPLTIKPHLFLVVGIVLIIYILRKKYIDLLVSFIAGFSALQLVTYFLYPQLYANWISMEFSPLISKTASLVTLLRESIVSISGVLIDWPVVAVPMVGLVVSTPWFIKRLADSELELLIPASLCISLGIAPYVMPYDFSLLLICQTTLLIFMNRVDADNSIRLEIAFMLIGLQLAIIVVGSLIQGLQYYFWIPWAMLVIWFRSLRLLNNGKVRLFYYSQQRTQ
ncbi:MAG: glycosyltransferase family 87 protein [Candidatus Sedimenticola sp. (ex Thyasira tokunagai)]